MSRGYSDKNKHLVAGITGLKLQTIYQQREKSFKLIQLLTGPLFRMFSIN